MYRIEAKAEEKFQVEIYSPQFIYEHWPCSCKKISSTDGQPTAG